ncbi:MAG: hypothetical protein ACREEO_00735 [Phenylobacterium sp.]
MPEKVTDIREARLFHPVSPGVDGELVQVVYAASDGVPRNVYIPVERDSPEERIRVIAEDLAAVRSTIPKTLELP